MLLKRALERRLSYLKHIKERSRTLKKQIDFLSCRETMVCKETQTEAGPNFTCDECNFDGDNDR